MHRSLVPAAPAHREIATLRGGAQAWGAVATGALAMGALAVGALAIGRLAVRRARIRKLEIDELVVHRLRVVDRLDAPRSEQAEEEVRDRADAGAVGMPPAV